MPDALRAGDRRGRGLGSSWCRTTTSRGSRSTSCATWCAVHGHVEVLSFDSRRYVGAQIGIHNPKGERVGTVSHVRNQEYVVIAGDRAEVRRLVDATGEVRRCPCLTSRRSTTAISARRPASRRGSTRTTSAGSRSARSVTCRWSCGGSTAPSRRPTHLEHMHGQLGAGGRGDAHRRALRRRQHAQHPRPLSRPRASEGGLLRTRLPAPVTPLTTPCRQTW